MRKVVCVCIHKCMILLILAVLYMVSSLADLPLFHDDLLGTGRTRFDKFAAVPGRFVAVKETFHINNADHSVEDRVFVPDLRNAKSCNQVLCGNEVINRTDFDTIRTDFIKKQKEVTGRSGIRIVVFTAWVGAYPLNTSILNHQQYCDAHGYTYVHHHLSVHEYMEQNPDQPPKLWAKVFVAKRLLESSIGDYYFYMDLDCVFARYDLRLESLLDPYEQYSMYLGISTKDSYNVNVDDDQTFIQTSNFILKDSHFAKHFVKTWLSYRPLGICGDLTGDQGAFQLALGDMYEQHYKENVSSYECRARCTAQGANWWELYICVAQWFYDNGFGYDRSDLTLHPMLMSHPHIYVYDWFWRDEKLSSSPENGFVAGDVLEGRYYVGPNSKFRPLAVHTCKHNPYISPFMALDECEIIQVEGTRFIRFDNDVETSV